MLQQIPGVACSVGADTFLRFARALRRAIAIPSGRPLEASDIVDFDLCRANTLAGPWGNRYELNCCEYERVNTELIVADGIEPQCYYRPPEMYPACRSP